MAIAIYKIMHKVGTIKIVTFLLIESSLIEIMCPVYLFCCYKCMGNVVIVSFYFVGL